MSGSNRTIVGLKPITSSMFCLKRLRQQSHHCGIETMLIPPFQVFFLSSSNRTIVGLKPFRNRPAQTLQVSQQSHHCGIETTKLSSSLTPTSMQQSHHCGIETFPCWNELRYYACSNRTIVGLKPRIYFPTSPTNLGSNRTIVGLKHA